MGENIRRGVVGRVREAFADQKRLDLPELSFEIASWPKTKQRDAKVRLILYGENSGRIEFPTSSALELANTLIESIADVEPET